MRNLRSKALLFGVSVAAGCLSLEGIPKDVCGNGIVDVAAGEDCDTYARLGMKCGAPGGERSCRFDCSATSCQDGWTCGDDAICRAPSGEFAPADSIFSADAARLLIKDFDNDGQQDVLTAGNEGLEIHYLDANLNQQQVVTIPTDESPRPTIGQLTNDTIPDIVLPVREGIAVLRGQADRGFSQTAYSSFALPSDASDMKIFSIHVFPDRPGDHPGAITPPIGGGAGQPTSRNAEIILVPPEILTGEETMGGEKEPLTLLELDYPLEELAGHFVVGHFIDGIQSPCEDIAVARRGGAEGSGRVLIVSPCCLEADGKIVYNEQGSASFVPPVEVPLPGDAVVEEGVQGFDVDKDGLVDLVVGAMLHGHPRVYAAKNLGGGSFDWSAASYPGFPEFPLAIAHLDGDSVPDYVGACGIHLSGSTNTIGPGCTDPSRDVSDGSKWTAAVIADMNANGILDVAAGSYLASGIAFYSGAGQGLFNAYAIATDEPVVVMATGDFDGDVVTDLAASQLGLEGDNLSLLFGQPYGQLGAPVNVGRLGKIRALEAGLFEGPGAAVDGITDLTVLSRYRSDLGTRLNLAFLDGSTDRQLYSPYRVGGEPGNEGGDQPLLALVGEFLSLEEQHGDLAVLTVDTATKARYRAWAVDSDGDAELDVDPAPAEDLAPGGAYHDALAALVDLDKDGADELVLLFPKIDESKKRVTGGTLMISRIENEAWNVVDAVKLEADAVFPPEVGATAASDDPVSSAGGSRRHTLMVADIDGDGNRDLAAVASKDPASVIIFWGDGAGGVETGRSEVILTGLTASELMGVVFLQADADESMELVALTSTGASLVDGGVNGSPRDFGQPASIEGVPGGEAIAAADMDNDGFDDLILASDSSVRIYVGRPVLQ